MGGESTEDQNTVQEARELLIELISHIRDTPDSDKFLYGNNKDMSRQWLKPLWDVCYIAEKP